MRMPYVSGKGMPSDLNEERKQIEYLQTKFVKAETEEQRDSLREAFATILNRYRGGLLRNAHRELSNTHSALAEEIVQNIFMECIRLFEANRYPWLWHASCLFRRLKERSIDAIRKETRVVVLPEIHAHAVVMEDFVNPVLTRIFLDMCLEKLDPRGKALFVKIYLLGYSKSEYAKEIGLTPQAVGKQCRKVSEQVKVCLKSLDTAGNSDG